MISQQKDADLVKLPKCILLLRDYLSPPLLRMVLTKAAPLRCKPMTVSESR